MVREQKQIYHAVAGAQYNSNSLQCEKIPTVFPELSD